MILPSYQHMMLPLLRVLAEAGKEMHHSEYDEKVAELMGLTEEQRDTKLPSGGSALRNRTGWAAWTLQQAKLVEKVRRGHVRITDEGRRLLATNPASVDLSLLMNYPGFVEKMAGSSQTGGEALEVMVATVQSEEQTPTEQIELAEQKLKRTLASDLLDLMGKMDPYRFEELVVDLLFAMGYGGSRAEAALVTQKSNDEGIDGIINEDRLGLDVIYVQAKRWQSNVGRPEIQSFIGALAMKYATKGVFITTSGFNTGAVECAKSVPQKVVLIDGRRLADLMIEHNVGVSTVRSIAIKRVDSDYFEE
jgi:restriction system protein